MRKATKAEWSAIVAATRRLNPGVAALLERGAVTYTDENGEVIIAPEGEAPSTGRTVSSSGMLHTAAVRAGGSVTRSVASSPPPPTAPKSKPLLPDLGKLSKAEHVAAYKLNPALYLEALRALRVT